MTENVPSELLTSWNQWGQLVAYALFDIGVLIVLVHLFRLITIRDKKNKYDYINKAEINLYWYASLFIVVAAVVYSNTLFR